ncbi:adenylate/guanylate cyclase domain-containing protein [Chondrinema litorale]|uniref:adenylate/guanylate cyclase domain-containing protein n=1 Tax=Chondrinema litorale TaxID=2994555 RepID=UPI002543150D|nr:adenylate/guanylate cyclase domain-containing protein [Chondrinema litorale]UZR97923.1 adenylate/guanylate cyclase domain-containing protein [Chondrinema litorale]
MDFRTRKRLNLIKNYIFGWTLSFIYLCIVRGVGTIEVGSFDPGLLYSVLISLILGPICGVISGGAQIITLERVYRKTSIQKLLILRVIYGVIFIWTLILLAYFICITYLDLKTDLMEFAFDEGSLPVYLYIITVDIFFTMLTLIDLMLGPRNLGKLLQGKFYYPHEEERIFMFLDLQSSTQLAEKLGHIKYSMLIQDCFNDLSVVIENEAAVYQYVGDEVILTWKLKDGLRKHNCIQAYFNYNNQLLKRKAYYEEKYNCLPFFKAGVNSGIVTVTEVGSIKKEIAYHGDTLNTAARIQGKCNHFQQGILISETLKMQLFPNSFLIEEMGNIPLRGKMEEVTIYAVSEKIAVSQTSVQ